MMTMSGSRFGPIARHTAVTFVALLLAMALLAQPALGSTPVQGTGTFAFAGPPLLTSVPRTAGGNTFLSFKATGTITGAISGAFSQRFTQVIHSSGESNINGAVTCTCSVGGRTGTVELPFEGTGAGTAASPFDGQFVAQNGTGGLADLHGVGTFHAVGPAGTITFNWHFDP
jgi:hypothetical protein